MPHDRADRKRAGRAGEAGGYNPRTSRATARDPRRSNRAPRRFPIPAPRHPIPAMNVLFEDDGQLKAGTVLADQDTSLQVEVSTGRRLKV